MQDQRAYLKVKIKSLAEEARIIREEERKPHADINEFGYSAKRTGLYNHRVGTVRREARAALLAYGFIRGRKYRQIEVKNNTEPDWEAVQRMVVKYGLQGYRWKIWSRADQKATEKELIERFTDWVGEGTKKE
jgi:hypothetical protein